MLKYILLSWFTLWDATVIQCGVRTSCETPWSVFLPIRFPVVEFFKPHMSENLISKAVIERKISLQNKWSFLFLYFPNACGSVHATWKPRKWILPLWIPCVCLIFFLKISYHEKSLHYPGRATRNISTVNRESNNFGGQQYSSVFLCSISSLTFIATPTVLTYKV